MGIKQKIVLRLAVIYFFFGGLVLWILFELFSLKVLEAGQWEDKARQLESSSRMKQMN